MGWIDGIDPEVLAEANRKAQARDWPHYKEKCSQELRTPGLKLTYFQKFLLFLGYNRLVENIEIKKLNKGFPKETWKPYLHKSWYLRK